MIQDDRYDNGANLIIDALLTRMSELGRFSDDEHVIADRKLLPLDVVVDECGDFGFVSQAVGCSIYEQDDSCWFVNFVGDIDAYCQDDFKHVRTIYETEGAEARAYLAKYLGGRKWH